MIADLPTPAEMETAYRLFWLRRGMQPPIVSNVFVDDAVYQYAEKIQTQTTEKK